MNIHKLGRGRVCFSLYKFFVKIVLTKKAQEIKSFAATPKLGDFLEEKDIANYPRVLFQKDIFGLYLEVCERVRGGRTLSDGHEAFCNRIREVLPDADTKCGNISWQSLLNLDILKYIKAKPDIYKFIEDTLKKEQYPSTGMHGDLNPNNILIDCDHNFWIVDWENSSENGSVVWDLCWFYGNWKRNSSKPGKDIVSIYNQAEKNDTKIQEILLIYALMKIRVDLHRHNKSLETTLNDFFERVSAIIVICQTSINKPDQIIQNENK